MGELDGRTPFARLPLLLLLALRADTRVDILAMLDWWALLVWDDADCGARDEAIICRMQMQGLPWEGREGSSDRAKV